MHLLFRALGLLVLAVGVVFAVGDIARSLADETTQLVTIETAPGSSTIAVVGTWSMSITCGALGLGLMLLGHRGRRRRQDLRSMP